LKQEGISYLAGAELPCLIVNVMRGGPGLGTIQPSQADYFQAVKGGGHGDYHLIALAPASVQEMADFVALGFDLAFKYRNPATSDFWFFLMSPTDFVPLFLLLYGACGKALAPASVQEMADFVALGFDLAFKYRNPAIILADGIIGQMMEKVVLPPFRKRRTEEEIREQNPWATLGKTKNRKRNVITSLELDPAIMEQNNIRFQSTYKRISENEVRFEEINCENADYLIVAFGSMSRICQKTIELAAEEGIKIGLLRPITLWPFPTEAIARHANHVKGILSAELNAGQMVEDVRLAVNGKVRVEHFGRLGGIVPTPDEVLNALKEKLM